MARSKEAAPADAAKQAAAEPPAPSTPVGMHGGERQQPAMLFSPRADPAAVSPAHFACGGEAPPGTAEASDNEDVPDMAPFWWAKDSGDEEAGEEEYVVQQASSETSVGRRP
jgi:hypothetical protein